MNGSRVNGVRVFISHKLLLKHNIWLPLLCSSSILLQLEAKLVNFRGLCQDLRANTNINYKLRDSKTVCGWHGILEQF